MTNGRSSANGEGIRGTSTVTVRRRYDQGPAAVTPFASFLDLLTSLTRHDAELTKYRTDRRGRFLSLTNGGCGHDDEHHERFLTGVELERRKAAFRERLKRVFMERFP